MDLKIKNQSLAVNETVFSQTLEQPIDISISLPDYCEDMVSILKCRVVPRILSKNVSGQTVMLDGNAAVNIIYLTNEGHLRSVEYMYPFTKSVDVKQECDVSCVLVTAKSEYINCRALTPRKVDIHGSISVGLKVVCTKVADVIVEIDAPDIQVNRKKVKNTVQVSCNEKYLIMDEEFALPAGNDAICGIIRHDLHTTVNDCKIIGNKAVVKGDATLDVLYYNTKEKVCKFSQIVPFSQIVEAQDVNDGCKCTALVSVSSEDLRVQNAGENNSGLCLNAKLCVTVLAVCENEIPAVVDAFSTDYESEISCEDISFEWIQQTVCEKFLCKKNLEFADVNVESVLDFTCDAVVTDTQITNNQLVINGVVSMCIVFTDDEKIPHYSERPVEFKYCCDIENEPQAFRCEPKIEAVASSFTITGENCIDARVELCVCADLYAKEKMSVVTTVNILENTRKTTATKGALVIYYAKCDESIWSIARRYNTSPTHIKNVNSIECDTLCEDVTLLIPCK